MKLARNGNAPRPAPQGWLNFEVRKGRLLVPATLSYSDKRPFVPAGISGESKKVQGFLQSPLDIAIFAPRLAIGAVLSAQETANNLQASVDRMSALLGTLLEDSRSNDEKQRAVAEALELRLADCLQKGVAAETELLTVVMSHVADNVKQQLPPQLRDAILGIEAPTWRQDPNAAQQSVSSGLEAIPEARHAAAVPLPQARVLATGVEADAGPYGSSATSSSLLKGATSSGKFRQSTVMPTNPARVLANGHVISGVTGSQSRASQVVARAKAKAKVHFQVQRQVSFGDKHKIVGNAKELGKWNVDNAPEMSWNEGNVWTLDVELPSENDLEFKCVKVNDGYVEWEGCSNRTVEIPNGATSLVSIDFSWNEDLNVDSNGGNGATSPSKSRQYQDKEEYVDDRPAHLRWQGGDPVFMKSNEHSNDRQGVWDSSGLEGFAKLLVEGDEKAASWLSKMQVTKNLLVDGAGKYPRLDALANAFIYLQWINTGAIQCKEGGGHFRPNKHAELARDIFKSLERAIGEDKENPLLKLTARKMQAKLPSFTEQYTQATPLTRIRDIAHRNDIPHDLKQEIKHTIQNKLHRNAGPEDLVATESMLQMIKADSSFSRDFVREFEVFAAELRDFFNAGSFAEMLDGIHPALDEQEQKAVSAFLEAKRRADTAGKDLAALNDIFGALHSLTSVRANILYRLSSGLRNDATDASIAMRQKFRLTEIRAEDYAYVLVSRILNIFEEQGGLEELATSPDFDWALPLGIAVLMVRHIGLGSWQQSECLAMENELVAWQQAGGFGERETALRLKASLERVQRLTQMFTDGLLSVLPKRVNALGKALGISEERIQVFTESEVRASLVFQLSKLCSLLLKGARARTGGDAWDALVAGNATGKLIEVERIEAGALSDTDTPVILLVKQASGDEEVGAAGANLRGVILCHSLPHLSHLGVRARQEKVVFVTSEDTSVVDADVTPLIGSKVTLSVQADHVTIGPASDSDSAEAGTSDTFKPRQRRNLSKTEKVTTASVVPLEKATTASCGSKSAACSELARLAQESGTFSAPAGVCLPFGCMEAAIREHRKKKEYDALLQEVEQAQARELGAACAKLQQLVLSCTPAFNISQSVGSHFARKAVLIVRSSANVEDLAGMSGAGLYESVANVPGMDEEEVGGAIAEVWASLYTRRAVLSRRAAGVPQREAAMAVLIQEQLDPELSFVLHTSSPLDKDDTEVHAELAVGQGETLASGTRGSAWRLAVGKASGDVSTLAFANFSQALEKRSGSRSSVGGGFRRVVVDYSKQDLSLSGGERAEVGGKLAEVGVALEQAFGCAQDVEGALQSGEIFVVQTRPQP